MSKELTFYTNPQSRGRIVRWMLEEVGAPYTTQVLDYAGAMKSPDYLAINPMGKVPAIRHGDAVVTETAAICAYLADAFPDAGLAPALSLRSSYYRWMFFVAGPLESAVLDKAMGLTIPDDKKRSAGYGSYDDMVATLEQAVAGKTYIAGDRFSAADVYVGSHIIWGLLFKTLPQRPTFENYTALLRNRPAYQRAQALDDALIPPSQAGH